MPISEIISVATTFVVALGGGGAIVFGLSSWLGKVWADRLMATQTAKHQNALAEIQANLRHRVEGQLAASKTDLDIFKDKHLKGHNDKISCYRLAIDVVVEVLGDLDYFFANGVPVDDSPTRLDAMNRGRIRAYGYLAMLAPQEVMSGFDNLFDYLLLVVNRKEHYHWPKVRELSLALLNEIRKDIGVDPTPISYFGKL